jgi:uncharacterized protein YdaU (DUF1376 family)
MHWFPFYSADFLAGSIRLGFAERGTYAMLLIVYYESGGPLPLDPTELYRMVGCESDADRRAVDRVLLRKFVRTDSGWVQERCEQVIAEQQKSRGKRVAAAKKRWEQSTCIAYAKDVQPEPEPEPKPKPEPEPKPKPKAPETLPSWLPRQAWEEYLAHRRAKRARLTPHGVALCLKKLDTLRQQGHDPRAVIDQSIANGWTGLFEIKRSLQVGDGIQEWLASRERSVNDE